MNEKWIPQRLRSPWATEFLLSTSPDKVLITYRCNPDAPEVVPLLALIAADHEGFIWSATDAVKLWWCSWNRGSYCIRSCCSSCSFRCFLLAFWRSAGTIWLRSLLCCGRLLFQLLFRGTIGTVGCGWTRWTLGCILCNTLTWSLRCTLARSFLLGARLLAPSPILAHSLLSRWTSRFLGFLLWSPVALPGLSSSFGVALCDSACILHLNF